MLLPLLSFKRVCYPSLIVFRGYSIPFSDEGLASYTLRGFILVSFETPPSFLLKRYEVLYPSFFSFEKIRGFVSLLLLFWKDTRVCVPPSSLLKRYEGLLSLPRKKVYFRCFWKDKRVCIPFSYLLKRYEGLCLFLLSFKNFILVGRFILVFFDEGFYSCFFIF